MEIPATWTSSQKYKKTIIKKSNQICGLLFDKRKVNPPKKIKIRRKEKESQEERKKEKRKKRKKKKKKIET